jgi:DNA-directed RNA polymerase alpha subunit
LSNFFEGKTSDGIILESLFRCSIDELNLSVRAQHGLAYHGISTIGELVAFPKKKLLAETPHFGRISFNEIIEKLSERGLSWNK